ncbi:MAG: hypothetical protein ACHREM_33525 [Polyangiales bacterium]
MAEDALVASCREGPLETSTREDFVKRCERVAEYARAAGLTLTKMPHAFAVVVARNGKSVPFPVVTDDAEWRETTPEEAFYCAVTDAFAWCAARPGEAAFATLDAIERSEVPVIKRDLETQLARVRDLTELLGGMDALRRLWEEAGIDPGVAASIDLRQGA